MKAIGNRLRALRGDRTQKAMAEICAVTRQTWYYWERGERKLNLDHAVTISRSTGASLDWIIEGKGNPP